MSILSSALGSLAQQLRIMVQAGGIILRHPTSLVYPLVSTVAIFGGLAVMIGAPILAVGGESLAALSIPVVSPLAAVLAGNIVIAIGVPFLVYFAFFPTVAMFLKVAYTHEINEALHGHRSPPLAGVGAALCRFHHVVVAGFLVYIGGFLSVYLGTYLQQLIPGASKATTSAYSTITKFIAPAIVTHNGSLNETFGEYTDVLDTTWQGAAVSVIAVQRIVQAIVTGGMLSAIILPIAWHLELLLGGWEFPAVIAVAIGSVLISMTIAALLQATIKPIIATALYVYALEGTLPAQLGDNPDALVTERPAAVGVSDE